MKLTIFSRMVISLLAIFFLSLAVSIYTIYQLHTLEDITNSIITGNKLLDFGSKLSDDFLSMRGFEKKYIISKDEKFINLYSERSKAFNEGLNEIKSAVGTPETRSLIERFKKQHKAYRDAFEKEVEFIKSGADYPKELWEVEREHIETGILEEILQHKESKNVKWIHAIHNGICNSWFCFVCGGGQQVYTLNAHLALHSLLQGCVVNAQKAIIWKNENI